MGLEDKAEVFRKRTAVPGKTKQTIKKKTCYWLCQCEFVQITVCVEGVNFSQVEEFLQGLVDEDETNEGGKSFLCESGDVAHQRACIRGNQEQTQQGRPQANASPQRQIGQVIVPDVKKNSKLSVRKRAVY